MTKEYITMSQKEVDRLEIIQAVTGRQLKQREAAHQLGSTRTPMGVGNRALALIWISSQTNRKKEPRTPLAPFLLILLRFLPQIHGVDNEHHQRH